MLFIRVNLNTFSKTKPEIFLCAKSIPHFSVENTTETNSDQTRKNVLRCVCCDMYPRRFFTSRVLRAATTSMENVNLRLFSVFLTNSWKTKEFISPAHLSCAKWNCVGSVKTSDCRGAANQIFPALSLDCGSDNRRTLIFTKIKSRESSQSKAVCDKRARFSSTALMLWLICMF